MQTWSLSHPGGTACKQGEHESHRGWEVQEEEGRGGDPGVGTTSPIPTMASPPQHFWGHHHHHHSTTHIDHQAATLLVTVKVTSPTPSSQTSYASNDFPLYPKAYPICPLPSPDIYLTLPEKNHRRPVKEIAIPSLHASTPTRACHAILAPKLPSSQSSN